VSIIFVGEVSDANRWLEDAPQFELTIAFVCVSQLL